MYESERENVPLWPRTVAFVGVSGRTTCAMGLAEAMRQVGVPVKVVDATVDRGTDRWAQLSGWDVPVVATSLSELRNTAIAAGRDHGIATIIVDTPDLARDPAGLAPLLSVATDVFLTIAPSSLDASKVQPLIATLFRARGRLEQARAFRSQVLLNQVRGNVAHIPDLLDPDRQRILPFAPAIPARESYAQAFGEHPDQMVDAPFHALAASLLGTWAHVVTPRDPRSQPAPTPRQAFIPPRTQELSQREA